MVPSRCSWCGDDPLLVPYHDREWGRPVADDARLFEKVCLEGFQSGLSWLTILRKREAFRSAFSVFVPAIVAGYGPDDVERLLSDAGIVRNRAKIESTVNNARRALELPSLAGHLWSFAPPPERPAPETLVATSAESIALSKDLKRRGWTFVGPTTVYAFMQAVGVVDDHMAACDFRADVERARAAFRPPPAGGF